MYATAGIELRISTNVHGHVDTLLLTICIICMYFNIIFINTYIIRVTPVTTTTTNLFDTTSTADTSTHTTSFTACTTTTKLYSVV